MNNRLGRPRVYPQGSTSTDRGRALRRRKAAEGGGPKQFVLSGRAVESLALIQAAGGDTSQTAVVERLLEKERKRLGLV